MAIPAAAKTTPSATPKPATAPVLLDPAEAFDPLDDDACAAAVTVVVTLADVPVMGVPLLSRMATGAPGEYVKKSLLESVQQFGGDPVRQHDVPLDAKQMAIHVSVFFASVETRRGQNLMISGIGYHALKTRYLPSSTHWMFGQAELSQELSVQLIV